MHWLNFNIDPCKLSGRTNQAGKTIQEHDPKGLQKSGKSPTKKPSIFQFTKLVNLIVVERSETILAI